MVESPDIVHIAAIDVNIVANMKMCSALSSDCEVSVINQILNRREESFESVHPLVDRRLEFGIYGGVRGGKKASYTKLQTSTKACRRGLKLNRISETVLFHVSEAEIVLGKIRFKASLVIIAEESVPASPPSHSKFVDSE